MIWIVSGLLTLAGLSALALSQSKHHKPVMGTLPTIRRVRSLRVGGWLALALAAGFCVQVLGAGYGLVVQTALLNAAGVAVALILTYGFGQVQGGRGQTRSAANRR